MKHFFKFLILMILLHLIPADASARSNDRLQNTRKAWNVEMQSVKTDYLAKKLDLTDVQREKFVRIYTSMENEISQANGEARKTIEEVRTKGKAATDADYRNAARVAFDLKAKEGAIEKKYFAQFSQILTPAQLFALKDAEVQFTKELMKKHSSMRKNNRSQKNRKN